METENTANMEDIAPIDQQEDEGDLVGSIEFRTAVVLNTDWTVGTLYDQINRENIDLDPTFQRRSAWDVVRQSRLIESIIVGMPIPNIVLAEKQDNRGQFMVIDGKQRLIALKSFIDGRLTLRGLDIRTDLNSRKFKTLERSDQNYFENSTIRTTLIRNWADEKFLYAMFYRLNSGSLQLSPQELRRALVGGKLMDSIDAYIEQSTSFKLIFSYGFDRRMRDSELVLRFIAFNNSLPSYTGDLKLFLDSTVRQYEEDWDNLQGNLSENFYKLDLALSTAHEIFGKDAFKKYNSAGYERRINRAIFDCLARTFSDPDISDWCKSNAGSVIQLYQQVCMIPEFKEAIEKTTKSLTATKTRIGIWSTHIAQAMGRDFDPEEQRIK